jgi:NADH dehydrogenase FAD-containing subunit
MRQGMVGASTWLDVFACCQAELLIPTAARQVTAADGARSDFDSLIVATGFQTSCFGNDHWQAWNKCCAPLWCIITL